MKRKDIITFTLELINSDTEPSIKQSEYIHEYYERANKQEKQLIDNIFMALCGYSLESIINKPRSYFDFRGSA